MSTTQRRILSRKCPKIVLLVGGSFELRNSFPVLEEMVKGLEVRGTVLVKSLEDLVRCIGECFQEPSSRNSRTIGVVIAEPLNGCFSGMSADLLAQELGSRLDGEVKKATTITIVSDSASLNKIFRRLQGE